MKLFHYVYFGWGERADEISVLKSSFFSVSQVLRHYIFWKVLESTYYILIKNETKILTEIDCRLEFCGVTSKYAHSLRNCFTIGLSISTIRNPVILTAPYSITSDSHRSSITLKNKIIDKYLVANSKTIFCTCPKLEK